MKRALGEPIHVARVEISEEAAVGLKDMIERHGSTQVAVASAMVEWFMSLPPSERERWQFGDRQGVIEDFLKGLAEGKIPARKPRTNLGRPLR